MPSRLIYHYSHFPFLANNNNNNNNKDFSNCQLPFVVVVIVVVWQFILGQQMDGLLKVEPSLVTVCRSSLLACRQPARFVHCSLRKSGELDHAVITEGYDKRARF